MKLNETKWNYPNKLFSPFTIDETIASLHACEPLSPDELPDDLGRLVHRWKMQTNRREPCKTLAYLMISWMEPMEPCCFFPLLVWHRHFRNLKITQCANWLASLLLDAGDRSSMPLAELLESSDFSWGTSEPNLKSKKICISQCPWMHRSCWRQPSIK